MKSKTIKSILQKKHNDFINSIDDEKVKKLVDKNSIITGGSIVSMLLKEKVSDFDYYFTDKETAIAVAKYFFSKKVGKEVPIIDTSKLPDDIRSSVSKCASKIDDCGILVFEDKIKMVIRSTGAIGEFPEDSEIIPEEVGLDPEPIQEEDEKEKYKVQYISGNAITLSNKIQLITRFFGDPEEIHKNFDFLHATCYWVSKTGELVLSAKALEAIIAKELVYVGSRYPICSIMRIRKFIQRGWTINAGQIVKMTWQVSELDLTNIDTLEDQLIGVDSAYFLQVIEDIKNRVNEDPNFKIDGRYLFTIINRIFN
jgi:hypothetical protein